MKIFDFTAEKTTDTGTGDLTMEEITDPQFLRFLDNGSAPISDVYYMIRNEDAKEVESGLGTIKSGNILQRDTVIQSTNNDQLVAFSSGTKTIVSDQPEPDIVQKHIETVDIPGSGSIDVDHDLDNRYPSTSYVDLDTSPPSGIAKPDEEFIDKSTLRLSAPETLNNIQVTAIG